MSDDGSRYWNYRVIRELFPVQTEDSEYEDVLTIHEVYYDAEDTPEMWSKDPMHAQADSVDGLRSDLTNMLKALDKPVLDVWELPGG